MRIGAYEILPDTNCWQVRTWGRRINKKTGEPGEETVVEVMYPGTFPQALKRVLDNMVKDELPLDADLPRAVETVARLYATVSAASEQWKWKLP